MSSHEEGRGEVSDKIQNKIYFLRKEIISRYGINIFILDFRFFLSRLGIW